MTLLTSLAGQVLEVSLVMALVIALLLALRPLLGRRYRAGACYWVWLLVALRLVVPINISLPEAPVQITVPDPTLVYTQTAPVRGQDQSQGQVGAPSHGGTAPSIPQAPASQPSAPKAYAPALTLTQLAALVWAAGCVLFLAGSLLSYALFRWKLRRWRQPWVDGAVMEQFRALRAELGVKNLTLAVCPAVPSPLVTGFVRPTLLLPGEDYSPDQLDAIFRHELTHARRHDLWYKLLLLAARTIHWFNPLVHLMARRAEQDLEISCDEAVVAGRDGGFRARYGHAVLAAAEQGLTASAPLTSHFKGEKGSLRERLAAIAGKAGRHRGVLLVCAVALVVAVAAEACAVGTANSIVGVWDGDGTLDMWGTQMPIEFARQMVFRQDGTGYVQREDGSATEFTYSLWDDTVTWAVGNTSYGLKFRLSDDTLVIQTGGADAVFTRSAEEAPAAPTPTPTLAVEADVTFRVPTGGARGELLVAVDLAAADEWYYDQTFSVWSPSAPTAPLQTWTVEGVERTEEYQLADANFDGYMDFGFVSFQGAANLGMNWFLWDEGAGQFVHSEALSGLHRPQFHAGAQIVSSYWHNSATEEGRSFWQWQKGQLVCVRSVQTQDDPESPRVILTVDDPVDGVMTQIFQGSYSPEEVGAEVEKWYDLSYQPSAAIAPPHF